MNTPLTPADLRELADRIEKSTYWTHQRGEAVRSLRRAATWIDRLLGERRAPGVSGTLELWATVDGVNYALLDKSSAMDCIFRPPPEQYRSYFWKFTPESREHPARMTEVKNTELCEHTDRAADRCLACGWLLHPI